MSAGVALISFVLVGKAVRYGWHHSLGNGILDCIRVEKLR